MSAMRSVVLRALIAAVVAVVMAGCESRPLVSPSPQPGSATATPPASTPSALPSESPTATERPPDLAFRQVAFDGFQYDAVRGSSGWVTAGLSDPAGPLPAVRYSRDGEIWQDATMQRASQGELTTVAWSNGTYVGVGTTCVVEGQQCRFDAVTWRSTDGMTWRQISEGIPDVGYIHGPLAVSADGALVLGWVSAKGRSGVYRSRDGTVWTRVDPTELGDRANFFSREDVVATEKGFVFLGAGCTDCPPRVFTSGVGRHWDQTAELELTDVRHLSLATDGRRLVAAILSCGGGDCRTEVWTSSDTNSWTRSAAFSGLDEPLVAFAGTGYVLVGIGGPGLGKIAAYVSSDGQSWSERTPTFGDDPPPFMTGQLYSPCTMEFLAGGLDDVVMGAEQCGAWRAVLP
jgi:hypothetical protein